MTVLGHIAALANFSGRENRQPFWLWILIVWIAQTVIGVVAMVPIVASMIAQMEPFAGRGQAYADAHPEMVGQMMHQVMGPIMHDMLILALIMGAVWIALTGAAVVRRLHDGDRAGWWAAPVFAMHIAMPLAYLSMLPRMLEIFAAMRPGMTPDQMNAAMLPMSQSFGWLSLFGMIGFLMMIVLIVFCALPGTRGVNRYGEDPLAFR